MKAHEVSRADPHLNALQRKFDDLNREYIKKKAELKPLMIEITSIKAEKDRIGSEIHKLKHNADVPLVTDHAIVRYLERVEGINIDEIVQRIARHAGKVQAGNVIVTVNREDQER